MTGCDSACFHVQSLIGPKIAMRDSTDFFHSLKENPVERMLWTGRPDPPVVLESNAQYWRRRSIRYAIALVLLGPAISALGFLLLMSDGMIGGRFDPLFRTMAAVTAPAGVPVMFAGIAWLLFIAFADYLDDAHRSRDDTIESAPW